MSVKLMFVHVYNSQGERVVVHPLGKVHISASWVS